MTFLAPQFLWAFLALIPLAAAYFLKVKPRKQSTNVWFLWEKVFKEKNTSSLFSRLKNFLSLILMLIALSLIILSLSQPRFSENDTRDLIIVIDRSASMSTHSTKDPDSTTRIELAKTKAHDLIRTLQSGQKASIAVIDQDLRFLTHLSSNTHRLHQAIDAIQPSPLALSTDSVSALIKTTLPKKETTSEAQNNTHTSRIILITDGCGDFPDLTQTQQLDILNIAPDTTPDNLGIIAADIQLSPYDQSAQCMVKITSSLSNPTKAEIELFHPATNTVGKLTEVTITSGINKPFFFTIPSTSATTGEWIVKILRKDQLPLDNSAQLILRSQPSIPVTIPQKNNYFYQRCIEAFAKSGGSLTLSPPSSDPSHKQIHIVQGTIPENAPAEGNFILFAPQGKSPLWTNLGPEQPVYLALASNPQHPIIRHLDLNQINFNTARQLTPPSNAKIIVKSDNNLPLIYHITHQKRSVIVINTDPAAAELYLSPHFPVIIYDAATYLSGHSSQLASVYPAGTHLQLNPEDIDSDITTPTSHITYQNSLPLDHTGIYQWSSKGTPTRISASPLSTTDSSLHSKIKTQHHTPLSTGYPLHFWLIVIAISILILESILYHRRHAA